MENTMIVADPDIMLGKPVIVGTRITVDLILEKMATGEAIEQILEEYPQLTKEGILAALAYASDAMKSITTYSAGAASD